MSKPPQIDKTASARLSMREREVLTYAAAGATNTTIAYMLAIKVTSVRSHIENARVKLNAKNKTQAVAEAIRTGQI